MLVTLYAFPWRKAVKKFLKTSYFSARVTLTRKSGLPPVARFSSAMADAEKPPQELILSLDGYASTAKCFSRSSLASIDTWKPLRQPGARSARRKVLQSFQAGPACFYHAFSMGRRLIGELLAGSLLDPGPFTRWRDSR